MNNTSKSQISSLKALREALKEADALRLNNNLNAESLALLEEAALSLRTAERVLIAKMQDKIVSDLNNSSETLALKASEIRQKVKEINKTSTALDYIERFLKSVVKILTSIAKLS